MFAMSRKVKYLLALAVVLGAATTAYAASKGDGARSG